MNSPQSLAARRPGRRQPAGTASRGRGWRRAGRRSGRGPGPGALGEVLPGRVLQTDLLEELPLYEHRGPLSAAGATR